MYKRQVFTIWDIIFRTADFSPVWLPTGDAKAPEALATGSYLEQQVCGARMFFNALFAPKKKAAF